MEVCGMPMALSSIFERMRTGVFFVFLATMIVAAHLCHSSVLWADDNLPLAAAMEVARGKTLYHDVWFDKPPLVAWIALAWGARAGVALRLAGAAYVVAVAWMFWCFARAKWGEREGLLAGLFAAWFLTFGLPSAVIPLASDMLLVLPHVVAIYFAWRGRAFLSGIAAGVGLLASSKAIFVLAACMLWCWRSAPMVLLGFVAPNAIALGWMWMHGSVVEYYRQAWQWGSMYASNTFVENPVWEGLKRTADWAGFQIALVIGAAVAIARDRKWRMAAWIGLCLIGVMVGLRFFPRYYFLLLVPMIIAAARGWSMLLARRAAMVALVILVAIPMVRFGPRYITLARGGTWRDMAIDADSHAAAAQLLSLAQPGDTLFVWGFRPDIFIDSRLPAGTRFLESQAISGLLADRHLFSNAAVAADFVATNRRELIESRPTWVVDGLGVYNPAAAIEKQPYLREWLEQYKEVARTGFSILYRVR
jgi:hypothetical protein